MRDFRDAKVMAHALRDALNAKAFETTHSECLELIAKAFGYGNWNILSAKIEAALPNASNGRSVTFAGIVEKANDTLHCSFCGKSQYEVRKLVGGPTVFICAACVGLCGVAMLRNDAEGAIKAGISEASSKKANDNE